jgi:hypothetical protein
MEIIQFQAKLSRFNDKRKLITIPLCINEALDKYEGQRIRIRLETIDDDLK